nr:hypothetical protein [Ktedonospora formicarum]
MSTKPLLIGQESYTINSVLSVLSVFVDSTHGSIGNRASLNGIFAFAIWVEACQQLFIARDHLGVKPLFYAQVGSSIVFGSEINV